MVSQTNWKSRYAELLQQQDRQSQRHKKKNFLLCTALVDAARLARGFDKGADDKLLAVQALVRREKLKNVDLEPAVLALTKQAKLSLELRRKLIRQIYSGLQKLSSQARGLSADGGTIQSFRALEKKLREKSKRYSALPQLLEKLTVLHREALNNGVRQTPSFWHGWFSSTAKKERQPVTVPNDLSVSLGRLMQEISPPEEVSEVYESACLLLETEIEPIRLPELIAAVCEVVDATIKRDRNDFECFLSAINERLQDTNRGLVTTHEIYDDEVAASQVLDQSMREQVGQLRGSVSAATDLNQLKLEVSANVDRMMAIMDANQTPEKPPSLSKELDSLVEKVRSMELVTKEAEIKIAEQRMIALTDSLTQLPNREAYQRRATEELDRWQRYERPLCLAVCDIDYFKKVNDNYGHVAGDEVLKDVAGMLQKRLRENDFVARFGGEEFVVLLPETEKAQALHVMETIRAGIDDHCFSWQEQKLNVTVSIGIANFKGKDNLESAFTRADKALYVAKDSGRNRCEVAAD